jgi:hypothetical protein
MATVHGPQVASLLHSGQPKSLQIRRNHSHTTIHTQAVTPRLVTEALPFSTETHRLGNPHFSSRPRPIAVVNRPLLWSRGGCKDVHLICRAYSLPPTPPLTPSDSVSQHHLRLHFRHHESPQNAVLSPTLAPSRLQVPLSLFVSECLCMFQSTLYKSKLFVIKAGYSNCRINYACKYVLLNLLHAFMLSTLSGGIW